MTTNKALEDRVKYLEAELARLTGKMPRAENIPPEERPDFIPHGSERHAAFLGLRKAEKGEELQHEGYALRDLTLFGVGVRPMFLKSILQQKVSQLLAEFPQTQSDSPMLPHFAPPMWVPDDIPVSGIV